MSECENEGDVRLPRGRRLIAALVVEWSGRVASAS